MLISGAKFNAEDAVSVDTSDYDLMPPGTMSQSPGLVLAITEGPRLCYHVRVWLRFGGTLDLTVPAEQLQALDSASHPAGVPGLAWLGSRQSACPPARV